MTLRTDVAVVGASTAGLATALGLARAGVAVTLVDTAPPPGLAWSAVHHWSVLPVLDELGVLDEALLAGEATAHWGLRVLETGERLVFDLRELGPVVRHPFHLRLEPGRLRSLLRSAFREQSSAREVTGAALVGIRHRPGGVAVHLDAGPRVVEARWVVGADGPASQVRRQAGVAFEGTTWTERCVVALVDHDFGAAGYADTTFQVDGRYGAVVERVPGTGWRYTFQEPLRRGEDGLRVRVEDVVAAVTGTRAPVLDWTATRMHQRCAASYRSGNVVLVGEAAHVTHPMVGHTALPGWRDASSLVPVLLDVLGGPSVAPLDEWAEGRRRSFLADDAPTSLARRHLVAQIIEPSRRALELDTLRRALSDAPLRRQVLLAGVGGVPGPVSDPSGSSPF